MLLKPLKMLNFINELQITKELFTFVTNMFVFIF